MELEDARAVLAAGPVCDACLGRVFAGRSHGLTNDERGRSLRVTDALLRDEPFEAVPPEECWVCEGTFGRLDEWADHAVAGLEGIEFATYQVGTRIPPLYEENDALLREDAGLSPGAGESMKSELNREVGRRLGHRTGTEVDFERPDVLVLLNLERGDVDVQVNPAFVYGRYRKLERDVPQTEWPCRECGATGKELAPDGGERPCGHCGGSGYLYETSVEGLVAPHVCEAMDGTEAVFHGAGREDVDARMLGTGRPFVVEVKRPRTRTVDVDALEGVINEAAEGRVEVEGLALADHRMVERVKELDASKTYRMTVAFDDPVTADALADALATIEGTTVDQETPHRVDHRRASRVRRRTVYAADGHLEDDRTAVVEVHGEGGLYVKELISGDEGRTEPSLAGLLDTGATVTALDVLAVEGEDEQFFPPEFHGSTGATEGDSTSEHPGNNNS